MQILTHHLLHRVKFYSWKLFPCIQFDLKVTASKCLIKIVTSILNPMENNFKHTEGHMKSSVLFRPLSSDSGILIWHILNGCFFFCGFSPLFLTHSTHYSKCSQNASIGWSSYIFLAIISKGRHSEVENKHFKEHAGFLYRSKTFFTKKENQKGFVYWKGKKWQPLQTLMMVCTQ